MGVVDKETVALLHKYDCPVPRYTSYPTAVQFDQDISDDYYKLLLRALPEEQGLSLYLHIPFCRALCHYCGCFTRVVNHYDPIKNYVSLLCEEIRLVRKIIGRRQTVSHIHFGGGSPNYLSNEDFVAIMALLSSSFDLRQDAEIAMEMDPRLLTRRKVELYALSGVNRASLGVQDFNHDVQKAIGRIQPYKDVAECVSWLRDAGIDNINFDLIYGLPCQDEETILDTIDKAISLSPDRMALFAYAHVPWMKQQQKKLEQYSLPDMVSRFKLFETARYHLMAGGYKSVGIDHFVQQNSALSGNGSHRNFQGYTTDEADVLLGFGLSSISSLPQAYIQNTTSFKTYKSCIQDNKLPTVRGRILTEDDRLRADIIESLMCRFEVDLPETCHAHNAKISVLSESIEKLKPYQKDNLLHINDDHISITSEGLPFTRLISACFDTYWEPEEKQRHAQAV